MYDDAVLIALGSSLKGGFGSSKALLSAALEAFPAAGLRVLARSSWWRSSAWPDPAQPAYINGVAAVATALSPPEVMGVLHGLETRFGRVREAPNAARTLDLDLIAHGRWVSATDEEPVVPHPRAAERLFVMGPLAEIAPAWRHPTLGQTAAALAARATVGADARPMPRRKPV